MTVMSDEVILRLKIIYLLVIKEDIVNEFYRIICLSQLLYCNYRNYVILNLLK